MESGAADKDGVMSLKVSTKRFQWSKQLATFVAVFALLAQPMYGLVASKIASAAAGDPVCVQSNSECYTSVQAAVNAAIDGDVITLQNNVSVAAQITINKTLTIEGNGNTISAPFAKTSNSNNAAISIHGEAHTATLRNVVLDGTGSTDLHGVNVYVSNAMLKDVTIKNFRNTAVNINGSEVTVENITTSGNTTGSYQVMELGRGSGVSRIPKLTVNGVSSHSEVKRTFNLYSNHIKIAGGGIFTDTNSQYTVSGSLRNLVPVVAPAAPVISSPTEAAEITTASGAVTIEWGVVTGAESYLVSVDGGAASSVAGTSFTTTLAAGSHSVTVQSVGPSNLMGGTSLPRTFTVVTPQSPIDLNVKETASGNTVVHLGYTNKDKLTASWTAPANGADSTSIHIGMMSQPRHGPQLILGRLRAQVQHTLARSLRVKACITGLFVL